MKLSRGRWPLLLLLAAARPASPLLAQTVALAAVRGEVTETQTHTPVPGAVVRWLASSDAAPIAGALPSAVTTAAGAFSLPRPAQAADRLIISALGYQADTVLVPASGAPYLRLSLRAGQALSEVTVTARGPAYSAMTPANAQVITSRDLTKSACCNLAESFETNAAVEVSTSDAVSGARQIQLLGLDGAYSLLTIDNQPALRGLAAPYRLGYLAGPWIDNIEIIKGTGSVVNGYEAISGQVNVRLKEPDLAERLLVNVYGNDLGKTDFNLNASTQISPKWSALVLLHTDHLGQRVDRNADGFLDLPLATQFNGYSKWKYKSGTGFVTEFGGGALRENPAGRPNGVSGECARRFHHELRHHQRDYALHGLRQNVLYLAQKAVSKSGATAQWHEPRLQLGVFVWLPGRDSGAYANARSGPTTAPSIPGRPPCCFRA